MSLRAVRGRVVWWTVGMTLGLLLLTLGLGGGAGFVSPGPLSFAHSSAQSKCADCHQGAIGPVVDWLSNPGHRSASHENSDGCIRCHGLGKTPLLAHSLSQSQLDAWTASIFKIGNATQERPDRTANEPVACADCHKEHRGAMANLKQLTDSQCQTCHAKTFRAMSDGHPEFTSYPFTRRTRINFDHNSHLTRHFANPVLAKVAPQLCLDCHQSDPKSGTMLVDGFEATCAPCHADQVKGKGAVKAGFAFLSLPRFDDRVLAGAFAIGEWPEDADQDLCAFEKFLLDSDPEVRSALESLKGVDLSNLPKGDTAKLKAAQQLAWAIKGLLFDLQTKGQDALFSRVEKAIGHPLTPAQSEAVAGGISPEVIKATFSAYFPKLSEEVKAYREKQKAAETTLTPSPKASGKGSAPEALVKGGGWYGSDVSFSVSYRPSGHADRFLTKWIDLTAAPEATPVSGAATALFNELTAQKATGLCMKCHSVESRPAASVQWHAGRPDPMEHKVTRFSHASHLSLLDNRGCQTCHALKEKESGMAFADSFAPGHRDPTQFFGNFKPIEKAVCAECHKPGFVRDDCLLCHSYHVGRFEALIRHSELPPPKSSKSESK